MFRNELLDLNASCGWGWAACLSLAAHLWLPASFLCFETSELLDLNASCGWAGRLFLVCVCGCLHVLDTKAAPTAVLLPQPHPTHTYKHMLTAHPPTAPTPPLQDILAYIKKRTAARAAAAAAQGQRMTVDQLAAAAGKAAAAAAPADAAPAAGPKLLPGGVNLFFSEADLDAGGSPAAPHNCIALA